MVGNGFLEEGPADVPFEPRPGAVRLRQNVEDFEPGVLRLQLVELRPEEDVVGGFVEEEQAQVLAVTRGLVRGGENDEGYHFRIRRSRRKRMTENMGVMPVPAARIMKVSRFSMLWRLKLPRGLEIMMVSPVRVSPRTLLTLPSG